MQKIIQHLDLFSGPGGICTGFRAAGINTVMAVEKVKSCVDTYTKNHPKVEVLNKDIREVVETDLKILDGKSIDVITSGMPCETFSTAGSKSRSFYDHRQQLYYETIRIADFLKPKIILFENVPGILTKKVIKGGDRLIVDDIFDDLSSIGYKYYIQTTLSASDFGVPQNRDRYFIIATNDSSLQLCVPIAKHNGKVTVKEAFSDLPLVDTNIAPKDLSYTDKGNDYTNLMKDKQFWKMFEADSELSYHVCPKHRPGTIERFKLIDPGENLRDIFMKFPKEEVESLQAEKNSTQKMVYSAKQKT